MDGSATAKGKSKTISKGTGDFAKGGNSKMLPNQAAGPQTPGQSASKRSGDGGKFAKGGNTKMFGNQSAKPAKAR